MNYKISDVEYDDKRRLKSMKISFHDLRSNHINPLQSFLRKAFSYLNKNNAFPPIPEDAKVKKKKESPKSKVLFKG